MTCAPELARQVLLVGWDAADWQVIQPLLDAGLMPALESLIDRGVMGNLATLQPVLSPMLWNSVATGKLAHQHGIHGFIEPDPIHGGARPYTSTSRRCKALWNILSQSGRRSQITGWWASHPAEPILGTVVTNAFGGAKFDPANGWSVPAGTVHPPELAAKLAKFKVFPGELTEAHLLPFIPRAAEVDQLKDHRLDSFAKTLSDAASIHAVATALLESEPWDFAAIYYDAIDHFSHGFMQYHPPQLPWIRDEDFAIYSGVMEGAYRFHDLMLARLLELVGPETTVIVCSDHGFESGALRMQGVPREPAGPAASHRQYGIFVMAGPGMRRDERIYGASLIDLAPTVLTLFGLPIGEDFDGRPLLEAWETPPVVRTIPSWEEVPGDAGRHVAGVALDREQAADLMQQFAALGYIENPRAGRAKQAESATIESKYNLARLFLWKDRVDEAWPLLLELVRRRPWEERFLHHLATCALEAGYLRQAAELLAASNDDAPPTTPRDLLLLAQIQLARGQLDAGRASLLAAEAKQPRQPQLCTQLGLAFTRLRLWDRAAAAFGQAVAADENHAVAWQGLSTIHRRRGENQETVDTALRAVSLLHRLPLAHFNLGIALARSGELARARVAFETALRFRPGMVNAHRYLAVILRESEPAGAREHRRAAARHQRAVPPARLAAPRAEERFDLPPIPPRAERLATLLRERPDPAPPAPPSGRTFIVVSGLPRSGTSLMMQILQAGGLPILTDGERVADADNPRGYLEWEPVKRLAAEPQLLDDAGLDGHAFKCVTVLLRHLPARHRYLVIFMLRPVEEIVRSQQAMLQRLRTTGAASDEAELARALRSHRDQTRRWLATAPHCAVLDLRFAQLLAEPAPALARVVEFLGIPRLPRAEQMAAAIDRDLPRQVSREI